MAAPRWDEDRLHRWLAARPPRGVLVPGHDAATLARVRGRPVLCTDQTIEGVHFAPGTPAGQVGSKAVRRALSDLAAAAARPLAVLCALAAPPEREERWLRGLLTGARRTARAHGAELVGGDLSTIRGPASIAIAAFGSFEGRLPAPGRARARAGELVLVTGSLGGSLLGRHLRFTPRLAEGRALAAAGARALMDVSDGLAWDLFRLARAAGVGIELELERVPVHADARRAARASGRAPLWHALHDGEDHELIATLSERAWARLAPSVRARCARIGRVHAGRGLVLVDERGLRRPWSPREGGWRHGR